MNEQLIRKIRAWVRDYETTQPANLCLPDDDGPGATFEESAYVLFRQILTAIEPEAGNVDESIQDDGTIAV